LKAFDEKKEKNGIRSGEKAGKRKRAGANALPALFAY
jgi:hypothetical protein